MKRFLNLFLMICLMCVVSGCGTGSIAVSTAGTVDYGDAESFEAALNAGENLEGKIVRIKVVEFHPTSAWGYNLWAGEHLNFVSSRNPDIKEGDEVTLKVTVIENVAGSWKISYEKAPNAVDGENTIYSSAEAADDTEINAPQEENAGKETTAAEPSSDTPAQQGKVEDIDGDFASNQYYDVVEEATYTNYSYTTKIYKVLAKQNISLSAQMLAYSPEGSVIGKSSSDITLTEGEYNYFKFMFESDVSDAALETTVKAKNSYSDGERNAIEMVDYNVSGENLYITFRQVSDNPGSFAKFKILFYNNDQIVGDEDGYFSVYVENLDGKDSTDVASLWVYGETFDRIEYIFEP